jgi:hypothetical protein
MLRATVWTVGLFGAGTAISRAFPAMWTEPVVLLALGIALLFVSARTARTTRDVEGARPVARVPAVAPKAAPGASPVAAAAAAAAAAVQVERTA